MKREDLLNTLQEIIKVAGCEEIISVSENINELADFMIYQQPGRTEYFAIDGSPLFPLLNVKNILYKYGEEKIYNYEGTYFQLIIELDDQARLIVERGEDGSVEMFSCGNEWYTTSSRDARKQFLRALERYNEKNDIKVTYMGLLYSVAGIIESKEYVEDSEIKEVVLKTRSYMNDYPEDNDFLFQYTGIALHLLIYEDKDAFEVQSLVRRIVQSGWEDGFINHLREEYAGSDDFRNDGYYLSLAACALRLIREIREEDDEMKRDRDYWIAEQILAGHYKGFYQLKMWPLDSYSALSIEYDGKLFPTAEHLYQARKFEGTNQELFEEIRCSQSPHYAKRIAHIPENEQYVQKDWDTVKVEIMREICSLKLIQHPYIKDKLIESGNMPLAEFSKSDSFWGIGEDGRGENMLGRIWEGLRMAIKSN